MLMSVYSFGQARENLKIVWPEEYKWKVGSNQENGNIHMVELIPGNETLEKWTILGTMMSLKGAKRISMDKVMKLMYEQAKQNATTAALTLIERDDSSKNPWIIFKIECAALNTDRHPESQLYYIIQGQSSLYSNFVAVKQKKLSDAFVNKWKEVFKASELVMQ